MKRCWFAAAFVALLIPISFRPGAGQARPGSSRSGQEIFQACLLCHSTKEMQRGPILDGLPAWYSALQLKKFKAGARGALPDNRSEALMATAMSLLRDEGEIQRVAEFIASQPPQAHLKTVRGNEERGKILFLSCIPCHGDKGQGNPELKGPPLDVQEDWYLLDQLRKFKAGQRGSDSRDLEGKAMQLAIASLDAKDFRDVVRYIAQSLARTNGASRVRSETTPQRGAPSTR